MRFCRLCLHSGNWLAIAAQCYTIWFKVLLLLRDRKVTFWMTLLFESVYFESDHGSSLFRYSFPIPKLAPDGQRIMYFALKQTDPSYYHSDNTYRIWIKALMTMIMEIGVCPGYTLIYDLKGFTFAHMALMNISLVKGYLLFSQVRT